MTNTTSQEKTSCRFTSGFLVQNQEGALFGANRFRLKPFTTAKSAAKLAKSLNDRGALLVKSTDFGSSEMVPQYGTQPTFAVYQVSATGQLTKI